MRVALLSPSETGARLNGARHVFSVLPQAILSVDVPAASQVAGSGRWVHPDVSRGPDGSQQRFPHVTEERGRVFRSDHHLDCTPAMAPQVHRQSLWLAGWWLDG